MSTIRPPARQLNEFEELIFEYSSRLGMSSENEYWDIDAERCNLRFDAATRGPPSTQASYLLTVSPNLCNYMGNLHGGCAATLIDVLSTTILLGVSRPGRFALGGVSRNLKVTYLRPVPEGSEIRLVCILVHAGKRLALLRAEIQRVDNGDLCIVGEHEKANTDPEADGKL
ncbi:thioesterase [Aspergillus sp. HF37]|nr:thioesterase [Aspergillus sp. HF37]